MEKAKTNFNDVEERKQYHKKYYNANKEVLLAKVKQKIECGICHKKVCKAHFAKHLESVVHRCAAQGLTRWGTPLV
jgi:hypothetical protein